MGKDVIVVGPAPRVSPMVAKQPAGAARVFASDAAPRVCQPDPSAPSSRCPAASDARRPSVQRTLARALLALLLAALQPPVSAATVGTVYVSYAEGSPRYASQRLDGSYRLFIRGKTRAQARSQPLAKAAGQSRQEGQRQLTPMIEHYARVHQVMPALVAAVVAVESGFDASAVSAKGAAGAMQLMPATAARYGVTNAADPAQNIDAGVRHLKDLLRQHRGNVALALAAYNAGQGAVARNGDRIPPYRETMLYVPAVLAAAARRDKQ